MLFLKLDCGRTVSVDALDYARTYARLMDGRPNALMNAEIIEDALTSREGSWGKRAVYLISPVIDDRDPDHPSLPPVLLRVWLTCYEPIDSAFMGSNLVVVWFADECHTKSIENLVLEAVRELAWEKLAEDFDW